MTTIVVRLASRIAQTLFFPEPVIALDEDKREAFERAYQSMLNPSSDGAEDCGYPKWELLRYLVRNKGVVLHGSNRPDLQVLEPREQTDYSGKRIRAVFASGDAIWPIFFAIVNTTNYRGSLRNGCWVIGAKDSERRFYFFSLNEQMLSENIWTDGTIYVLPGGTFELTDKSRARFDEWASATAVRSLARVPVGPGDFPFLRQVAGHREGESMVVSWLKYKRRCSRRGASG